MSEMTELEYTRHSKFEGKKKLSGWNTFNEVSLMDINVKSVEVQNKNVKTQLHST